MNMFITNRYEIGDRVNLSSCESTQKAYNYIFFKENGGWGIANEKREVVHTNNFSCPFLHHKLGYIDDSLVIIKNVDTGLYGVISMRYAKEIIPFKYTFIKPVSIEHSSNQVEQLSVLNRELFFLVNTGGILEYSNYTNVEPTVYNGIWGLLKESGEVLINTRYYNINFKNPYIECYSTEEYIYDEYFKADGAAVLRMEIPNGKIDLYTINGDFIVGGIEYIEYSGNYILLYTGIKHDYVEESDEYEYCDGHIEHYTLQHPVKAFDDSACLIINSKFKPVLKSFPNAFHLGMTFVDKNDFCNRLIGETIITGCSIDMLAFDKNNLLFLRHPNRVFIIPDFQSYNSMICLSVLVDGNYQNLNIPRGKWIDNIIEEKVCVVVKISEEGTILWSHRVNDITKITYDDQLIYQDGDLVGICTGDEFLEAKYSAFSLELSPNKNKVVALKETCTHKDTDSIFGCYTDTKITYYELNEKYELIKIEDNRNVFDPKKHSWFPENFKENNGLCYDRYAEPDYLSDGKDCGWTREMLKEAEDIALEGHSWLELGID